MIENNYYRNRVNDTRAFTFVCQPCNFDLLLRDNPTGYHGFSSGYHIGRFDNINKKVIPGSSVWVRIDGKKAGDSNSLVLLEFFDLNTEEVWTSTMLANSFRDTWTEGHKWFKAPPLENAVLKSIHLYRYPNFSSGTVWYGPIMISGLDEVELLNE